MRTFISDVIICNNQSIDASSSLGFVPKYQDPFRLSMKVITDPSITNANGMVGIYYDDFRDKDQNNKLVEKSFIHIRWRNNKFLFKFQTDLKSNDIYFESGPFQTGKEYLIELSFDGTNCYWYIDGTLVNKNQLPLDCSAGFSERLGENIKLCHQPDTKQPDWKGGFWNGAITQLKFESTKSSPESDPGI